MRRASKQFMIRMRPLALFDPHVLDSVWLHASAQRDRISITTGLPAWTCVLSWWHTSPESMKYKKAAGWPELWLVGHSGACETVEKTQIFSYKFFNKSPPATFSECFSITRHGRWNELFICWMWTVCQGAVRVLELFVWYLTVAVSACAFTPVE